MLKLSAQDDFFSGHRGSKQEVIISRFWDTVEVNRKLKQEVIISLFRDTEELNRKNRKLFHA